MISEKNKILTKIQLLKENEKYPLDAFVNNQLLEKFGLCDPQQIINIGTEILEKYLNAVDLLKNQLKNIKEFNEKSILSPKYLKTGLGF